MIIYSIQMLTSGQAKFDQLGGPIMIGQLAGQAFELGLGSYFALMALISCNLATPDPLISLVFEGSVNCKL